MLCAKDPSHHANGSVSSKPLTIQHKRVRLAPGSSCKQHTAKAFGLLYTFSAPQEPRLLRMPWAELCERRLAGLRPATLASLEKVRDLPKFP
jgi:hypothetical protein